MIDQFSRKSGVLFAGGYCCAESVLMAVAEGMHIESDLIPRIATGFCGGLARSRGMCGAVSGAVMGINLMKGRQVPGQSQDDNYRALTGCDLGTDRGQKQYREQNIQERCTRFVETATRLTLQNLV
jgi:C_GCAxxG_C_C family probable redox protein